MQHAFFGGGQVFIELKHCHFSPTWTDDVCVSVCFIAHEYESRRYTVVQ